jgi:pilus assembly protein CpaF
LTWEKLLEYRSVSPEMRDLIQSSVDASVNILVAGGTASGKTTLANRIVDMVAPEKRIVSVERSHEFRFTHKRAVYLEAGGDSNISMKDLLDAASKLRPDLLVAGELHDNFVIPTLQVFANGHFGLATMHATSAENALSRMETMCLMNNPGLGLENIRELIASAFQLLSYQELLPSGRRKVTKLVELCGIQDGRYVLQPLMRYNPEQDTFDVTGVKPSWEK